MNWKYWCSSGTNRFKGRRLQDIVYTLSILLISILLTVFGYAMPIILFSFSLLLMSIYSGYASSMKMEYQFQTNETLNHMSVGSIMRLIGFKSITNKKMNYVIEIEKVKDNVFSVYTNMLEQRKKMLIINSGDILNITIDQSSDFVITEISKRGGEVVRRNTEKPVSTLLNRLFMLRIYPSLDVVADADISFELIDMEK